MPAPVGSASQRVGAEQSNPEAKRRRIGDFEIVGMIGRGPRGAVFRADQVSRGRMVALKVLYPHVSLSNDAVRRFHARLDGAQCTGHPGIVPVLAAGRFNGNGYIAQELVGEGRTLAHLLEEQSREGYRPPGYFREATKLLTAVADALRHAHAAGVVHGALKPSNLLVAPGGGLRVTGFGLVEPSDPLDVPGAGGWPGAPCYLAPEQAPGSREPIDARTDVFSLGLILYEMLTLEHPFAAETPQQVLKKLVLSEPRRPAKISPDVPRDLSVIAMKAMEKDPAHRYQTMADLDHDLRRYLSGDVILARSTGAAASVWKRVKRHPAKSVADVVTATAVFLVVVVAPWLIAWSERDRRSDLEATITGPERPGPAGTEEAGPDGALPAGFDLARADRQTLDEAAELIGSAFANDPDAEATLRVPLGLAYYRLGRCDDARRQLERALELREIVSGDEDPKTAAVRTSLAVVLAAMEDRRL